MSSSGTFPDPEWDEAMYSGEKKQYYKVIKMDDYLEGKTNLFVVHLYTPSLAYVVAKRTGDVLRDFYGTEIKVKYRGFDDDEIMAR